MSSAATSATSATPRMRAVISMWKNVKAVIRPIVPNRKTQTGTSTPNHSLIVELAKYAVTPVTAAENTR